MFPSHEREVILALFQANDWFDLYALHEELLLSPAQIVSAVMRLQADGLCEADGMKAKLNNDGVRWVLKNRREIFLRSGRKWSISPLVDHPKFDIGEPYMPRLKSIDKDFFRKLD